MYDGPMSKLGIPPIGRKRDGYLDGKFLLAMPNMSDERFRRSLIYLCAHSDDGAMGLIVNKPAENINFTGLLRQLSIISEEAIRLPERIEAIPVMRGGPVETGRGFVLHSADFHIESSTLPISNEISLTATLDILRALADGEGPSTAMLALGYAGWGAGQLEGEMQANGWLHCDADPDLIFSVPAEGRYDAAMKKLGVDPAFLAASGGTA
jgi:putative transcriptional regulator